MVRRFVQAALLFAIMVPVLMAAKFAVSLLDQRGLDVSTGVIVGMALMFGLWRWDERLRR